MPGGPPRAGSLGVQGVSRAIKDPAGCGGPQRRIAATTSRGAIEGRVAVLTPVCGRLAHGSNQEGEHRVVKRQKQIGVLTFSSGKPTQAGRLFRMLTRIADRDKQVVMSRSALASMLKT